VKITDVSVVVHERKLPTGMPLPAMEIAVLRIHTDVGIEGNTFMSPPGPDVTEQILRQVKPLLINRDPLDIGAIWHELWAKRRAMHSTVQGYVDVALWDIAGKAAGLPIHRLLGTVRHEVPAYVSSWVHPESAIYAEEAAAYKEQGFSAYKLHPPTQRRMLRGEPGVTIHDDIEACDLVRDQVGPQYRLMLDSAWAYSYPEALAVGHAIQDLDYYWYEDPLQADDIYGYRRLKQQLSIPIMATEMTEGGVFALAPWLVNEATDFLRGDVVIKGGITGMMKIAHLAEAFNMNCEVHDAYNALNNVATLHIAMAMRNCEYFEVIVIHPPGEYDTAHLSYGLTDPIHIDSSGSAHAPTRPGLGYDIDWELIRATQVAELR
jgi:L-alanine-DL-glutamate epimerase-like enolase superfamily enzyme